MDEDNLFPDDIDDMDYEDLSEEEEEETIGYKTAALFDYESGEFIFNGSGQIIDADGITAWQQWCENVIATERYKHDSYTDDIGIDYDEIFNLDDQEEIESMLEAEISEALECDPYGRTQYVQNIDFEWISTSEVIVRIDVVGMESELISIEATIAA